MIKKGEQMSIELKVTNFDLLVKTMSAITNAVDGVKISVSDEQTTILTKNTVSRIKIVTNSLVCDIDHEFCINQLASFVKVLNIAKSKLGDNDKVSLIVDEAFIKIKSKPFKSKFSLCKEESIISNIDKEFVQVLDEQFTFKTNVSNIKELERSSFIFSDASVPRIYLFVDENNNSVIKAELNNRKNPYSNAITIDFGQVTSGTIDRELIINYDRIRMFKLFRDINEIELSVPSQAMLISNQKLIDGDYYVKARILTGVMKD